MGKRVTLTAATLKRVWLVPGVLNDAAAEDEVRRLRYEARLAHHDGRNAQAGKFHKQADLVSDLLTKKRRAAMATVRAAIAAGNAASL